MDTCDSVRRARPLLGTFVDIACAGPVREETVSAIEAAFAAVAAVHRLMSFHDVASDVSRLNADAATSAVRVHSWTFQVLEAAIALHCQSAGTFDVAVAPILQRRGLLPRQTGEADADGELARSDAIELLPGNRVRFRHLGVRIDLGGIAKGFAVDRALDVLREHGQSQAVVNAGGDLAVFGPDPQTVHIRDPRAPCRLLCQVVVANAALASSALSFNPLQLAETSATAVIDPATRQPAVAVSGATVRAASCMTADALTKIVMIAGEGASPLLLQYHASALLILQSGEIRVTPEWHNAVTVAA